MASERVTPSYNEESPMLHERCMNCGASGPWGLMAFHLEWCELCTSEESTECPNCGPLRNYREDE